MNDGLLKKLIERNLQRLDKQSDEKKQHELGLKLLTWVREYRERKSVASETNQRKRMAGYFAWGAIGFAVFCAVILAFNVVSRSKHIYSYHWPKDYLRVIQNIEPCKDDGSCGYTFLMQRVKDGVPEDPVEMHFCRDYQPRWEMGHVIKFITYTDEGSCLSIDKWEPLREDTPRLVNGQYQRMPILSPNCHPDWVIGHNACDGGRATFEVNPNERRTVGTEKEKQESQEEAKSARYQSGR